MSEGIDGVLAGSDLPGLLELRRLLHEMLDAPGSATRLTDQQALQPGGRRVFRLRFDISGEPRAVVVKRLRPEAAERNERVVRRWLPAIGANQAGPPLLGSVAACSGRCVWHVYDDLGAWDLAALDFDPERLRSAIELVARIHTRFAGHALLGEVRQQGGDLGIRYYEASVRDAIAALRAWRPPPVRRSLRTRLLDRLTALQAEGRMRAAAMQEMGGPETLLHGDLWPINVFVVPTAGGPRPRLIDWDRAAVGPATYDLSTFLQRLPSVRRPAVFVLYRQFVLSAGWRLPEAADLNFIFETHELARIANRVVWPAIAAAVDRAAWGGEGLAEVDGWFESLRPVLPTEEKSPPRRVAASS